MKKNRNNHRRRNNRKIHRETQGSQGLALILNAARDVMVAIFSMLDLATLASVSVTCKSWNALLRCPDVCESVARADSYYDAEMWTILTKTGRPVTDIRRMRKRSAARARCHLVIYVSYYRIVSMVSAQVCLDITPTTIRIKVMGVDMVGPSSETWVERDTDVTVGAAIDQRESFEAIGRAIHKCDSICVVRLCSRCHVEHPDIEVTISDGFFDQDALPEPDLCDGFFTKMVSCGFGNEDRRGHYMRLCAFITMLEL